MRKKKTVLMLTVLFSTFLVLALTTSPIKAETEILTKTFYPTDDTYISEKQNTTNYGDEPVIKTRDNYGFANTTGWGWDALTKFNISTIPENSSILSATLNLYSSQINYYNQSHNKISIYPITSSWIEETVTWENQPSYQTSSLTSKTLTNNTNTWIKWNLTDDVTKIVNNTTSSYGWIITNDQHWGHFDIPEFIFTSKENQSKIKPYLEIKIKNHIPKPRFNYTYNISNKNINFTDNSTDPDGPIISYYWEFGDGTTSNQKNITHNYSDYGEYQVNLTVEDNQGTKTKTSQKIILNIEEKIKKDIEEMFNITLAENFYANNLSKITDPNEILTVEQTINNKETTFIISISNSLEKLFLWNTKEDNIKQVKYKQANILQKKEINNETFQIDFNITQNQSKNISKWNYIQINDFYPNISNLTIKRSDSTTVESCNVFRENQKIYFLDKNFTNYSLIYSNSTVNFSNETKILENKTLKKEKINFNLQLALILIIGFSMMPMVLYTFNKRKNMNNYIKNGSKKIKEIDNFLKQK